MQRGGKIIGTAALLSVAACGGEQGKLQIRASATPLAAGHQAAPFRIAEARGHLAMGNVALALEAFRKALRENPGSVDAMTGVAACYDRMARFDLSRRHYESALAIAPGDPQLLAAFAASLDLQGRRIEAASVRAEIKQRLAARQTPPQAAPSPITRPKPVEMAEARPAPAAAKPVRSVQLARNFVAQPTPAPQAREAAARPVRAAKPAPVPLPAPRRMATAKPARSVTVALPPAGPVGQPLAARPAVQPVAAPAPEPIRPAKPAVQSVAAPAPMPVRPAQPQPAPVAAVERVAVALPAPARPVAAPPTPAPSSKRVSDVALAPAAPVAAPATVPVNEPPARIARAEPGPVAAPVKAGPRLERTSLREVTLITAAPQWRALPVKRTQRSATVRFVPLRQASINLSSIRLLNAARVNRLAARTRSYLVGRGWTPMAIGNAPAVRARSVIFYPPEKRRTAQTLSAQFGFVMKPRPGSKQITVLLGRDAARITALRASG